jgi:alpha-ketoglutaric semialdehyde dehydrogenase
VPRATAQAPPIFTPVLFDDRKNFDTMTISGVSLIGQHRVPGDGPSFHGIRADTGESLEPAFGSVGEAQIELACMLAQQAFDAFRQRPYEHRALLLEAIAQGVLDLGPALIERAMLETGLPAGRLEGERARTVGQLRLFARVVRDGNWVGATLDSAQPQRAPAPRPDLRMGKIGLGPVAVFGASNFPLAFSVAGGDTASALAAGCPVVVKAHPAHPGTAALVGGVIQRAIADLGLPEGVFSLLFGRDIALGEALVRHPAIAAVGFTGSRRGGLALLALAQQRAQPIPVYAEMSAINPVLLLPAALQSRAETLAQGFVDSLTLGAGQFCTNPGLLLGIAGADLERFQTCAAEALAAKDASTMLSPGIHAAYQQGVARHAACAGVTVLARGRATQQSFGACGALFAVSAQTLLANPLLLEEIFGPAAVVVSCRDQAELCAVLEHLEGQLTTTLQLDAGDHPLAAQLIPILERKAGRILANGFPTGVEVSYAMVHGGPFPATSDARSTSVGAAAIERFLRPVCYQDLPQALLPEALRDGNPLALWRVRDGAPSLD